MLCKQTYRGPIVFKPLLGPRISQGCLSRHMPPQAPRPPTPPPQPCQLLSLGLAPFWETTVFLAGRERGVRPPCLALVQLGGWAYLLLLALTLPLALEHPRQKLCRLKESEEREWAPRQRTLAPMTVNLKQREARHLVPGESVAPRERREGLGLDCLPPPQ